MKALVQKEANRHKGAWKVIFGVGVGTNFVIAPIVISFAKSAGIDPIWVNDIGIDASIFTDSKVSKSGGNGAKVEVGSEAEFSELDKV